MNIVQFILTSINFIFTVGAIKYFHYYFWSGEKGTEWKTTTGMVNNK
jgi:hypothetical protein